MPLRVQGRDIPLKRSPSRELSRGFRHEFSILPDPGAVAGAGDPVGQLIIDTVPQQPFNYWCWAACVEMVLHFFNDPRTKCQVAELKLHRLNQCCGPAPNICDVALSVDDVGRAFEAVRLAGNVFGPLEFERIQARIPSDTSAGVARTPIVAAIKWQGSGGHLVVISGWRVADGGLRYVRVNDPYYTSGDIRFEDFREKYGENNSGKWLHTWTDFRRF